MIQEIKNDTRNLKFNICEICNQNNKYNKKKEGRKERKKERKKERNEQTPARLKTENMLTY